MVLHFRSDLTASVSRRLNLCMSQITSLQQGTRMPEIAHDRRDLSFQQLCTRPKYSLLLAFIDNFFIHCLALSFFLSFFLSPIPSFTLPFYLSTFPDPTSHHYQIPKLSCTPYIARLHAAG